MRMCSKVTLRLLSTLAMASSTVGAIGCEQQSSTPTVVDPGSPNGPSKQPFGNQIIIAVRSGITVKDGAVSSPALAATLAGLGVTKVRAGQVRRAAGGGSTIVISAPDVEQVKAALAAHADVLYVQPNYLHKIEFAPNDPEYPNQWAHQATSIAKAWDLTQGNRNIKIAVIDTGVDYRHPDLAPQMAGDCTNGCPAGAGWDTVDLQQDDMDTLRMMMLGGLTDEDYHDADNDPMDRYGHGTHCAGIAAAGTNNAEGVAGACPNCSLMGIRVGFAVSSPSGGTATSTSEFMAAGIEHAVDNGAKIISLSWGDVTNDPLEKDAIAYAVSKGVLVIASAGNESTSRFSYPAVLDGVVAVAATDKDGPVYFSNFGDWVDIAAPGSGILSTVPTGTGQLYAEAGGTSMSAPYVAGVAGLMMSRNSTLQAAQISKALVQSSEYPVEWTARSVNYGGRLNAEKAVKTVDLTAAGLTADITGPTSYSVLTAPPATINITGSVKGATSHKVQIGSGLYPATWRQLASRSGSYTGTLATVTGSSLEEGWHTIQVIASSASGSVTATSRVRVARVADFWPIVSAETPNFRVPFLAPRLGDVDGDGHLDVVTGATDWRESRFYGADGALKRIFSPGSVVSAEAVADVDGDGKAEAIYASAIDGCTISGFDAAGQMKWRIETDRQDTYWPPNLWQIDGKDMRNCGTVTAVDLDGNGTKELVVTTKYGNEGRGVLRAFSLTGGTPSLLGMYNTESIVDHSPIIRDVDGDGQREILVYTTGGDAGQIRVLGLSNGSFVAKQAFSHVDTDFHRHPKLFNVASLRSGALDLLTPTASSDGLVLTSRDMATGQLRKTIRLPDFDSAATAAAQGYLRPVVAAMDASGRKTTLLLAQPDTGANLSLYAFDIEAGQLLWKKADVCSYSLATDADTPFTCEIAVADLEGDGKKEVVLNGDGVVSAIDGVTGTTKWKNEDMMVVAFAIADLDQDGDLEVAVNAGGYFFVGDAYAAGLYKDFLQVDVLDKLGRRFDFAGYGTRPIQVDWNMPGGDPARTQCVSCAQ